MALVLSPKVDQRLEQFEVLVDDGLTQDGAGDVGELLCGWRGTEAGVGVGSGLQEQLGAFAVVEEDGQVEGGVPALCTLAVKLQPAEVLEQDVEDVRVIDGNGKVEHGVPGHGGLPKLGLVQVEALAERVFPLGTWLRGLARATLRAAHLGLHECLHDVNVLVHHRHVQGVVRLVGDAEHDLGHLADEEACEVEAAIAAGGVQEAGAVQRDGDVFRDADQYTHHVPVVDEDAVPVDIHNCMRPAPTHTYMF